MRNKLRNLKNKLLSNQGMIKLPNGKQRGEQEPKISLIVPIHNTERYLERCMQSLLAQTFAEIEIICVDDASPDNSAAIVRKLARKDKRIRLIRHQRNRGLGGARNSGIASARGVYVIGIDSDDYVLPTMMELLWQASGEGRAAVVACGMQVRGEEDKPLFDVTYPRKTIHNINNNVNFFSILNPSFCNKLWRKQLFTDNNISFPENQYFEDLAITPMLLHFASEIQVIPDALYCYVQRDGSIINSTSAKHILDHFKALDTLADFLEAQGLQQSHREMFHELIDNTLHYHARSVIKTHANRAPSHETAEYLRNLLLMKLAFLEHRDRLRTLEHGDLKDLLLKAKGELRLALSLSIHGK
jgi:glycosyltransferase involved in cell wall biosynthesis